MGEADAFPVGDVPPAGVGEVGGGVVGVVGGGEVGVVGGVLVGVVGGVEVGWLLVGVEPGACGFLIAIEGLHEFGTTGEGPGGSTPSTCGGTDCEGPGIGPRGISTVGVPEGPRPPWCDVRRQGVGIPEDSGPVRYEPELIW
ncbi:MAG TPA: hypothetical protein VGS62_09420 [Streptosporangiaceae bacterium]|nr:hypothetical protein [Streptosporangiaceae bacterium]